MQFQLTPRELRGYFLTKNSSVNIAPGAIVDLCDENLDRVVLILSSVAAQQVNCVPNQTITGAIGIQLNSTSPLIKFTHSEDGFLCQSRWSGGSAGGCTVSIVELILFTPDCKQPPHQLTMQQATDLRNLPVPLFDADIDKYSAAMQSIRDQLANRQGRP